MSPRRGLNIATIVEAAIELADKEGAHAVTLSSLSAKLGIRSPSLYNHINGLSDLRSQLALNGIRKLSAELEAAASKEVNNADEKMLAIGQAYISFARRHPGLYEMTLRAPEAHETDYIEASNAVLAGMLAALETYQLEEDEALHMIRGFRSLLHGFAGLERAGGFGLQLSVDESLSLIIRTYLAGMKL